MLKTFVANEDCRQYKAMAMNNWQGEDNLKRALLFCLLFSGIPPRQCVVDGTVVEIECHATIKQGACGRPQQYLRGCDATRM